VAVCACSSEHSHGWEPQNKNGGIKMKPEPQETKKDFGEDGETFKQLSAKTKFTRPTNQ
jgi:hypothetical protein